MAKLLIELSPTDIGKVLADFTWDFCKRISDNSDVATANCVLTEYGNGIYALSNPDVVADTAFRLHLTASAGKYASGIFSPADGDLARQSSLDGVKVKTDNLPAQPAAVGSAMALGAEYDAAKTAAPAAATTSILGELQDGVHGLVALLAAIGTRLAAADYVGADNASIVTIKNDVENMTTGLVAIHDQIAALPGGEGSTLTAADVWSYGERSLTDKDGFAPTVAEIEGSPVLAKQATLQLVADIADPMAVIVEGSDPPITRGQAIDNLYIPGYEGPVFVLPATVDPDLQFLHFYGIKGDKAASVGRKIEATPLENQFLHQYVIDKQKLSAVTDASGYASLSLIRGLRYSVTVAGWGKQIIEVDQYPNKTFAEYAKEMYDTGAAPPAGATFDTVEEL